MAKLVKARFVLAVHDIRRSSAYFRDQLGFEVEDIDDPGWVFVRRDDILIMLGECPDAQPVDQLGDHNYFGNILVEDIDAFYRELIERNTPIHSDLSEKPWGVKEFAVKTVDGHRIMFVEPI